MQEGVVIFIGVVVLLFFLAFQGQHGGFFHAATSTVSGITGGQSISSGSGNISSAGPPLTDLQTEQKIKNLFDELDSLSKKVREEKLREPRSPYAGTVSLSTGNVWSTDPKSEYLILRANYDNKNPVDISNWYLESYVTDNRAAIPRGTRLLQAYRSKETSDIFLNPGEEAYLISGKVPLPLNVSFHENRCSGYLSSLATFYPSLSYRCPYPIDELKKDHYVSLDNDPCYNYVQSLWSCKTITEDDISGQNDLSGACRQFLSNTLNYNSCVSIHGREPLFDNVGAWRVYLGRIEEIWRSQREIIRLMDGNDRVIDVVEY
jgi:hypothetical protein